MAEQVGGEGGGEVGGEGFLGGEEVGEGREGVGGRGGGRVEVGGGGFGAGASDYYGTEGVVFHFLRAPIQVFPPSFLNYRRRH